MQRNDIAHAVFQSSEIGMETSVTSPKNTTSLRVAGFELPEQLRLLIGIGVWPARVHPDCVKLFAPDEGRLDLRAPEHFTTVASDLNHGGGLTTARWAVRDIDPERTLIIADFELGSDTMVALDYRHNASELAVIRLVWGDRGTPNRWVQIAPTFDEFWAMIELRSLPDSRR